MAEIDLMYFNGDMFEDDGACRVDDEALVEELSDELLARRYELEDPETGQVDLGNGLVERVYDAARWRRIAQGASLLDVGVGVNMARELTAFHNQTAVISQLEEQFRA